KEGILEIAGAPKKGAGISDIIDLEISGKMTISPKYRSKTVAAIVKNGIAIIEFGLAEDVKVVEVGE
ncbi:hypothetical protein KA005_08950, partial [bacterium]|nr:hypothetical protein [bacterium]